MTRPPRPMAVRYRWSCPRVFTAILVTVCLVVGCRVQYLQYYMLQEMALQGIVPEEKVLGSHYYKRTGHYDPPLPARRTRGSAQHRVVRRKKDEAEAAVARLMLQAAGNDQHQKLAAARHQHRKDAAAAAAAAIPTAGERTFAHSCEDVVVDMGYQNPFGAFGGGADGQGGGGGDGDGDNGGGVDGLGGALPVMNDYDLAGGTLLHPGTPTRGFVEKGGYAYYQVCVQNHEHHHTIVIEVEALGGGDPDLYIDFNKPKPTLSTSTFISADSGTDRIQLPSWHPDFPPGVRTLYLGVYGRASARVGAGEEAALAVERKEAGVSPGAIAFRVKVRIEEIGAKETHAKLRLRKDDPERVRLEHMRHNDAGGGGGHGHGHSH